MADASEVKSQLLIRYLHPGGTLQIYSSAYDDPSAAEVVAYCIEKWGYRSHPIVVESTKGMKHEW